MTHEGSAPMASWMRWNGSPLRLAYCQTKEKVMESREGSSVESRVRGVITHYTCKFHFMSCEGWLLCSALYIEIKTATLEL